MKNPPPRKIAILSLVGFSFLFAGSCSSSRRDTGKEGELLIGVKIYDHKGSLPKLFAQWGSLGINTVFAGEALSSRVDFKEMARQQGIAVFIIVPVFYNPEELQKRPELYAITDQGKKAQEEWVEFVCPSRENYREQRIEHVRNLVRNSNPAGVSLDFIRAFVFWEKVYPERTLDSLPDTCFCEPCMGRFCDEIGIKLPREASGIPEKAAWIKRNRRKEWVEWKCQLITNMVKSLSAAAKEINPEILINVHAVPWREDDFGGAGRAIAGQDLRALADYTDFISPMCYSHMAKREPAWVRSVVEDIDSRTDSRVIPSIQVDKAYLDEPLTVEEFEENLREALKAPSRGVVFWSWESLDKDQGKKRVVQDILKKQRKNHHPL